MVNFTCKACGASSQSERTIAACPACGKKGDGVHAASVQSVAGDSKPAVHQDDSQFVRQRTI